MEENTDRSMYSFSHHKFNLMLKLRKTLLEFRTRRTEGCARTFTLLYALVEMPCFMKMTQILE